MLSCLETLLLCTYLVTWSPDLADKASRHQTSATTHLAGGGKGWSTNIQIMCLQWRWWYVPHLPHEETIRHFPPKHLHEISLLQLKLKLWVGTRGTLLRIIVVEGNKL